MKIFGKNDVGILDNQNTFWFIAHENQQNERFTFFGARFDLQKCVFWSLGTTDFIDNVLTDVQKKLDKKTHQNFGSQKIHG